MQTIDIFASFCYTVFVKADHNPYEVIRVPTLKDVAERANVTVTTVSRVLNRRGAISKKTADRVFAAMQEIGYHPNEAARSLSGKSSNIIGVIVPAVSNPFFADMVNRLEVYASEKGYKIILCNSNHEKNKEKEYVDMLRSNKVAGIVLASRTRDLEEFENAALPIVSFERIASGEISAVACDNYRGGVLATQHLIDCGCKNLVHIGGVVNLAMPADDRCKGFLDVCENAGVKHRVISTLEQHFRDMDYSEIVEAMLKDDPEVDGVFASSDVIAAEVLHVCYRHGIHVPEQMQVVGFDDTKVAQLLTPRLTSIHQPLEQMCRLALDTIIAQREGTSVPSRTVLSVQLIQRETTLPKV